MFSRISQNCNYNGWALVGGLDFQNGFEPVGSYLKTKI